MMGASQNPRHTGQETFENAAHTVHILMWCYRDFYGGTEAECTVIQRAKQIILLKACHKEFIKIIEDIMVLIQTPELWRKKVILLED